MSDRIHINFYYSTLLELFYFILAIVVNLLLWLIYKLNFILGIYVWGKYIVFIGFSSIHSSGHPWGVLSISPADKGGFLYTEIWE